VSIVQRALVGTPIDSSSSQHSLLSDRIALPVFCGDPLSSVAYATDEILLVLILGGVRALTWFSLAQLRARLEPDQGKPRNLITAPGLGYRSDASGAGR
jgi:hypothetical protein